ncbi:MAG TPA: hypothetical protein VLA93_22480 [Pyrinomonadaceae bacterium]|nr:hypothetical protein [Pyrinomonadaceae bacterium]
MSFKRLLILLTFSVLWCGSTYAQQPGPQFWRRLSCEPYEGRNKLESLELKYETLLIKGFTRITTVEINGVRIDAVDLRDTKTAARAMGVIVSIRESGERPRDARALLDYDEIDPFLKAIDAASKIGEGETRLAGFEARYKTIGDLELIVFRQTRTGIAVTLTAGLCDKVTEPLTLDELAKFRAMIAEAKMRLDEIK